jgi:syntaxin 16
MTTRNITKQFESLRAKAKSQHSSLSSSDRYNSHSEGGKSSLLSDSVDSNATLSQINTDLDSLTLYNAPKWVDIVDNIRNDFEQVDRLSEQLTVAYSQRLKVSFGNESEERSKEELIENITHQTTLLIKGVEGKIKTIAFCQDSNQSTSAELSTNEKNVRLNVMRNLGSVLHEKSKHFKRQQRDHLVSLQQQQHIGNDLFAEIGSGSSGGKDKMSDGEMGMMLDMALEQGLTEEQKIDLEEIEMRADEREKEIIHLAQNINELASLFQELNVLVIEQGTILDRIDYNVEQTLVNVEQGRVQLESAEKMSKSNWILKFIIVLLFVIIIEVVILVIKWKIQKK